MVAKLRQSFSSKCIAAKVSTSRCRKPASLWEPTQAPTIMNDIGAHYVVDWIWDVPTLINDINDRLAKGERP